MNDDLKKKILELLEESKNLLKFTTITHDYESLKQCIMQLELEQEVKILEEMLSLNCFEDQFKERCAKREQGEVPAIHHSKMSESITNRLYWDIAQLVFKPTTQYEMLDIIAPRIKTRFKISYPDYNSVPDNLNKKEKEEYLKQLKPKLNKSLICDELIQFPDFDELSYYVMKDKELLDLRDIKDFCLSLHALLLNELDKSWHQQLYSHNISLKNLSLDINILNKNGISPKAMITNLINRCLSGGSRMTGSIYASKDAENAEIEFLDYLNSLPNDTQKTLKALKYDGTYTLKDIVENEIKTKDCVETTALHLKNLLENNKKEKVLDIPANMTSFDLNALNNKYNDGLNVRKDCFIELIYCPNELIESAVNRISIRDCDELIDLLLVFPPEFYDCLFKNISIIYIDDGDNEDIPNSLARDNRLSTLFNPEQKWAIVKAVESHYSRFGSDDSILFWAVNSKDPELLEEVLKNASLDLIKQDMLWEGLEGKALECWTLLHRKGMTLQILKLLLKRLTREERVAALNMSSSNGDTALNYAAENAQVLEEMLTYYSDDEKIKAVRSDNAQGRTLMHFVATNPDSLKIILSSLSEKERFDVLKPICTQFGTTVVHDATIYSTESLKVIIGFLSEKQKLDLLEIVNAEDMTILYFALSNFKSLKVLFELLPKEHLLEALKTPRQSEHTLLSLAAVKFPKSLEVIFRFASKKQRLELVHCVNGNGTKMLAHALSNPESVDVIFHFLTDEQRLSLLESVGMNDDSQFVNAFRYPASLKVVFDFFSKEQRLNLFKKNTIDILCQTFANALSLRIFLKPFSEKHRLELAMFNDKKSGMTMLQIALTRPESLKVLFDLVSEEKMLKALSSPAVSGATLLDWVLLTCPESLKVILELLSEEQNLELLELLKCSGKHGHVTLLYALANSDSLKILFEYCSEEKLLDMLKSLDNKGASVLNISAKYSESLKIVLTHLSPKQRFEAVSV